MTASGAPWRLVRPSLPRGTGWAGCLFFVVALVLQPAGESRLSLAGYTLPEICLWRAWAGWACPTCGLTRSCVAIVHGDWQRAWALHPAGFVVVGLAAVGSGWHVLEWCNRS